VDDYADRLRVKLAPESMTRTLVRAGAFLSAYELIRLQVVDGVRDFYWTGHENNGKKVLGPDYETDVRARDKSLYRASVSWLVESDAITQEQAQTLEKVHEHRHEIAHELPKILIDPDFDINASLLIDAALALRSLDVFWGRISMEIDPRWDRAEVTDRDIWGGPSLLMGSLIEIAGLLPDDGTDRHGASESVDSPNPQKPR
jgi:hypothetical protein